MTICTVYTHTVNEQTCSCLCSHLTLFIRTINVRQTYHQVCMIDTVLFRLTINQNALVDSPIVCVVVVVVVCFGLAGCLVGWSVAFTNLNALQIVAIRKSTTQIKTHKWNRTCKLKYKMTQRQYCLHSNRTLRIFISHLRTVHWWLRLCVCVRLCVPLHFNGFQIVFKQTKHIETRTGFLFRVNQNSCMPTHTHKHTIAGKYRFRFTFRLEIFSLHNFNRHKHIEYFSLQSFSGAHIVSFWLGFLFHLRDYVKRRIKKNSSNSSVDFRFALISVK